jgi:hypothetical protein
MTRRWPARSERARTVDEPDAPGSGKHNHAVDQEVALMLPSNSPRTPG